MAEEEKDDLGPTEKVDESEGKEPEDVGEPGEGKEEIDYSKMSDEEILELARQEERDRIAALGLSPDEYESWEAVGTKLKEMMASDKKIYAGVKRKATQMGMTPDQYFDSWERDGVPPDLKLQERPRPQQSKEQPLGVDFQAAIKELQSDQLQADLRTQFQLFKIKMEAKSEIIERELGIKSIPQKMKRELEQYFGPVIAQNRDSLEAINLYEEALPYWKTGQEVKEQKEKAGKTKLNLLKRQLGISGKKTGGVTLGAGKASWEGQYEPK